jgi:DNA-binding response OmpR family regulator
MARILIVDDDPDLVEACMVFLQREGHRVQGAWNREEGLAAVAAFDPDLVVLGVLADPPGDGFILAQDLRRQGRNFPILMLASAAAAPGLAFGQDPERVPADDFLARPVEPAELAYKVARLLKGRGN